MNIEHKFRRFGISIICKSEIKPFRDSRFGRMVIKGALSSLLTHTKLYSAKFEYNIILLEYILGCVVREMDVLFSVKNAIKTVYMR